MQIPCSIYTRFQGKAWSASPIVETSLMARRSSLLSRRIRQLDSVLLKYPALYFLVNHELKRKRIALILVLNKHLFVEKVVHKSLLTAATTRTAAEGPDKMIEFHILCYIVITYMSKFFTFFIVVHWKEHRE